MCTVENLLTSCVPCKTYWHRVYRGKLTNIVCFFDMILTSYASWKTYWHCVYCGRLTNIVCFVNMTLYKYIHFYTYASIPPLVHIIILNLYSAAGYVLFGYSITAMYIYAYLFLQCSFFNSTDQFHQSQRHQILKIIFSP